MALGSTSKVLLVALAAGLLGLAASLVTTGPGPLLRSELGQRVLQGFIASGAPQPPAGLTVATRGERVEAFGLPGLDGASVEVPTAYAGRPVLINLWATWCGPCIEEMPELERFAQAQGDSAVQVVGIALDDAEAVQEFLRKVPVGYPILLDEAGPADAGVRLGNPKGVLPYSVLLDAQGRVVKQRIGPFEAGEIDAWVRR